MRGAIGGPCRALCRKEALTTEATKNHEAARSFRAGGRS